jgi:hypothetical protein
MLVLFEVLVLIITLLGLGTAHVAGIVLLFLAIILLPSSLLPSLYHRFERIIMIYMI